MLLVLYTKSVFWSVSSYPFSELKIVNGKTWFEKQLDHLFLFFFFLQLLITKCF